MRPSFYKDINKWWHPKKPWTFPSLRHAIQAYYTYNKDGFDQNIISILPPEAKELLDQIDAQFEEIFDENPFVSASALPTHSARYALGTSRAASKIDLTLSPRYNHQTGRPKYPIVGVVFVAFYSKEEYEQVDVYNVPKQHALGNINIGKALLNETEITFPGVMRNVAVSLPIVYPSFEGEYTKKMQVNFGLNIQTFNEFKKVICASKRDTSERQKIEEKLRKHLINHYSLKLAEIAKREAKKRNAKLLIEHPNGEYKEYLNQKPSTLKEEAELLHDEKFPKSEKQPTKKRKRKEAVKPNKKIKSAASENKVLVKEQQRMSEFLRNHGSFKSRKEIPYGADDKNSVNIPQSKIKDSRKMF